MEIIKMYNYEMVDLKSAITRIDERLKKNEEVTLDFKGIAGVDFLELEGMFSCIFSKFAYENIKDKLCYKNVNPVVKILINDIVARYKYKC